VATHACSQHPEVAVAATTAAVVSAAAVTVVSVKAWVKTAYSASWQVIVVVLRTSSPALVASDDDQNVKTTQPTRFCVYGAEFVALGIAEATCSCALRHLVAHNHPAVLCVGVVRVASVGDVCTEFVFRLCVAFGVVLENAWLWKCVVPCVFQPLCR
jgi:hypothetical protein